MVYSLAEQTVVGITKVVERNFGEYTFLVTKQDNVAYTDLFETDITLIGGGEEFKIKLIEDLDEENTKVYRINKRTKSEDDWPWDFITSYPVLVEDIE